jgi:signal transduction histidine kinase
MLNLIGNAIKFTLKGSISTKIEIELPYNNYDEDAYLKFTVKDTGIGIH